MKKPARLVLTICVGLLALPGELRAQGSLVKQGAKELFEFFARSEARDATEDLAQFGGEKAVRAVLEKAARQGGDELVRQVVALGKSNGPRALKAIEADPVLMSKALRNLPPGKLKDAVLEASNQPKMMADLVRLYGDEVLSASARHPGIGTRVIDEFGEAGLAAARTLDTKDVLVLAQTRGFDELPPAARTQFRQLLNRDPKGVVTALLAIGGGTAIYLTADSVNTLKQNLLGTTDEPGPLIKPIITYSWILGGVAVLTAITWAMLHLRRARRRIEPAGS